MERNDIVLTNSQCLNIQAVKWEVMSWGPLPASATLGHWGAGPDVAWPE